MRLIKEHPWYSEANEQRLVLACFFAIAAIAAVNAVLLLDVGLAFLYLVPLTVVAAFFSRWQLLAISLICTLFAEGLSHESLEVERIPRAIVIFATYVFVGFMVRRLVVNRRSAARKVGELEEEVSRQHSVDLHSQLILNSAPAGIVTVSSDGEILTCNRAAHEILGVGQGGLLGKPIKTFLSGWADTDTQFRQGECRVTKANGNRSELQILISQIAGDNRVILIFPSLGQIAHALQHDIPHKE